MTKNHAWFGQNGTTNDSLCILGLNFFQDTWTDWKRWEDTQSQGAPVSCQWINTWGFRVWLVRIVSMKLMVYNWWLANRSILGVWISNTETSNYLFEHNIHSKSTDDSLDSLSAFLFLTLGIWAAVIWMAFFSAHSQINFVK